MSKEKHYQNQGQAFIEKQTAYFLGKSVNIFNEEFSTEFNEILQEKGVAPIIGGFSGNTQYEHLKDKHQIVGLREKIYEINKTNIERFLERNKVSLSVVDIVELIFQDFVKKFNSTTNEAQQYQLIFTFNEQIKDKNKREVEIPGCKETLFYNVVFYEKPGQYSYKNSFYTIRERRIDIYNHLTKQSERPDFVHYINGIPLILIEYKTEDSGILQALKDFEHKESYQRIPFKIALNDGRDVLFFANVELLKVPQKKDTSFRWVHYLPEKKFIANREYLNIEYLFEELICQPENMYNYCVNGCTLVNSDDYHYLINARIQQYYALKDITRTLVNANNGLMKLPYNFEFAHAQRSGKTITMKLITYLIEKEFNKLYNTVFMYAPDLQIKDVITNEFSRSGNSRISLSIVESRSEYQKIIGELYSAEQDNTTHSGMKIFVVNMQKISEEEFKQTDTKKVVKSTKILNIIDEAHHGQTKETALIRDQIFPNASNYLFTATGKNDMYLYYFPDNVKEGFCNKFTISNAKHCEITVPVLFMQAKVKASVNDKIETFSKQTEDFFAQKYKEQSSILGDNPTEEEVNAFLDKANKRVADTLKNDIRGNSFEEKLDFLVLKFKELSYNLKFKPKFIIYCNSVSDAKQYIETIQKSKQEKSEKNFYKGYRFGTDFSSIEDICDKYNPGIFTQDDISTNFEKVRTDTDTENDSDLIIDALFAVDKYQKGFDLPSLLATFLDTNIAEPARLNQIYTRAATKAPGKTIGYCIDMAFESKNKETYQQSILMYDSADIEGGFIDEEMLKQLKEILEQEFFKMRQSLELEEVNFTSNMIMQQLLNEPDLKVREKRQYRFFNSSRNIIGSMSKMGSPLLFKPFKNELKVIYEAFAEFKKIYSDKDHIDNSKILINIDRTIADTEGFLTDEEVKRVIDEVLNFIQVHNIKSLIGFDYTGDLKEVVIDDETRDEITLRLAQELNKNNLEASFEDLAEVLKKNHRELFDLIKNMLSRISNDRSIVYKEEVQNEISRFHKKINDVKDDIQVKIEKEFNGDYLLYWLNFGVQQKMSEHNVVDEKLSMFLSKKINDRVKERTGDVPRGLVHHDKAKFIIDSIQNRDKLEAISSYFQEYQAMLSVEEKGELISKMKSSSLYNGQKIGGSTDFFRSMIECGLISYYKNAKFV